MAYGCPAGDRVVDELQEDVKEVQCTDQVPRVEAQGVSLDWGS